MKKPLVTDPTIRAEVMKQFEEGVAPKDIAVNVGISVTTTRIIINNGTSTPLFEKNKDVTKRTKINAYKDYLNGMSKDEICHKYNRTRNWLNQAIVTVRQWQDEAIANGEDTDLLMLNYAEHKKEYPKVVINGKRYIDVSADWM